MEQTHKVTHEEMATRSGWTPYAGETLKGWPVATMIRGERVMEKGVVLKKNQGKPISFG